MFLAFSKLGKDAVETKTMQRARRELCDPSRAGRELSESVRAFSPATPEGTHVRGEGPGPGRQEDSGKHPCLSWRREEWG